MHLLLHLCPKPKSQPQSFHAFFAVQYKISFGLFESDVLVLSEIFSNINEENVVFSNININIIND